ncbi:L-ornithine N(5)-monooxygenase [Actinidia chinensis var. chinensis]|uniref:L-ornithine N(5)-monooxygenase n=1 Tax=Actinidia chinensis var. chinensis TaxID=1590841 RepID=A0A2R6RXA9_ACTCC|nr:L-ornithine N(5)-monooxygenase [Actinidia chinensis var. chinensis]
MLVTSSQNNLALMNFWSLSILSFEPPRLQSTSPDQRIRILCIAVPLHPNLYPEISPYNNNIAIPMIADCSPHGILLRSLRNHRDTFPELSCPEFSPEYSHSDLHSLAI